MNTITKSAEETKTLAKKLAAQLKGGEVVCLYGDLGAGKTVFVQGLVEYFSPGKRVVSPTFIIVRHYRTAYNKIKMILHVDLYRMSDLKEIKDLEFIQSMNNSDTVVAVEWAEKLENLLPKERIDIRIKTLEEDKRNITIGIPNLNDAIRILKEGGIVIYPTDTAFGIGCRMDDEKSVRRLFEIRKRPKDLAVPVLVGSPDMARKYFLSPIPDNVRHLMEEYWPGALTIVYKCREDMVSPLVRGGSATVGLRMPNHRTTQALIAGVGVPILGPSANFHGQPTPFEYNQLDPKLLQLVDCTVSGECVAGNVSTVIDCVAQPWKIIRQGAVTIDRKFLQ